MKTFKAFPALMLIACSAAAAPLDQLPGAADMPEVPSASGPLAAGIPDTRFPTAVHEYFNTALLLNVGANDPDGDYYPFAGKADGRTDFDNNPIGTLIGGMGNESGHPSIFNNGGNTKRLWDEALKSYRQLDFPAAYEDIGIICHLTQDQAVPVHAANINHVITFGDRFEKSIKKNLSLFERIKGQISAMMLPDLPPYAYYQALQDDTRAHLKEWVNPSTKKPYWPPADGAPPAGQDATRGPWSHYSDDKDTFDVAAAPGIMDRQVLMAAVYTAGVLKSAAKLLPPVTSGIDAERAAEDRRSEVNIQFNVYDNRKGTVDILVERPLYGTSQKSHVHLVSGGDTIPSGVAGIKLPALQSAVKGRDMVVVTLTDSDGNTSRYETEVSWQEPFQNYGG